MECVEKIVIGQPRVIVSDSKHRLIADITFGGKVQQVWFEVDEEYGKYLCYERCDAYLIGLLNYAMRNHYDIECEGPVTAQLLYQIETYLIPSLSRHSKVLYATKIIAQVANELIDNVGAVGTGISCGVDSMHVLCNYTNPKYSALKLTHLVLNNVGAYWRGEGDYQYAWQVAHAKEFCIKYGYKFIVTNSNFAEKIKQPHLKTHTYSSCFAIYALQKLWGVYFYASSGYDFAAFSLRNSESASADHYELLSLDVFSTKHLKIYSEGGAVERFDKMRRIIDYEPSYNYLHVCVLDEGPNCGHCGKCLRTLTALDALGALDKYKNVFNIDRYRASRRDSLKWLYRQAHFGGDSMAKPAYEILKGEISTCNRVYMWVKWMYAHICGLIKKI